jgi:hypothetical protein
VGGQPLSLQSTSTFEMPMSLPNVDHPLGTDSSFLTASAADSEVADRREEALGRREAPPSTQGGDTRSSMWQDAASSGHVVLSVSAAGTAQPSQCGARSQDAAGMPWGGGERLSPAQYVTRIASTLNKDANKVVISGVLGQGSWGTVYKGVWRGLPVALKTTVFQSTLPPSAMTSAGSIMDATRAGRMHASARGPGSGPGSNGGQAFDRAIMEAAIAVSAGHRNIVATYYYDIKPVAPVGLSLGSGRGGAARGRGVRSSAAAAARVPPTSALAVVEEERDEDVQAAADRAARGEGSSGRASRDSGGLVQGAAPPRPGDADTAAGDSTPDNVASFMSATSDLAAGAEAGMHSNQPASSSNPGSFESTTSYSPVVPRDYKLFLVQVLARALDSKAA